MKNNRNQIALEDIDAEYKAFTEKFVPKKTTDDCYTPENIFQVIQDWACREYGIDPATCVRPFYPGGNYVRFDYPENCTVLDNPPFSILSEILSFYDENRIRFFLFAPALTCLVGGNKTFCRIVPDASITYANGANVPTAFVTNLDNEYLLRSSPELHDLIKEQNDKTKKAKKKQLPKYSYPDHVVTAAMVQYFSAHGVDYRLRKDSGLFIRTLDAQKAKGKSIFGGGFLLSEKAAAEKAAAEKAAAEKAAAEKAAAEKWQLSEYEKELIKLFKD